MIDSHCVFRPVVIEVPHFASLRGKEREVIVMRSDNGETWREHPIEATEEAVSAALGGSFEGGKKFLMHRKPPFTQGNLSETL